MSWREMSYFLLPSSSSKHSLETCDDYSPWKCAYLPPPPPAAPHATSLASIKQTRYICFSLSSFHHPLPSRLLWRNDPGYPSMTRDWPLSLELRSPNPLSSAQEMPLARRLARATRWSLHSFQTSTPSIPASYPSQLKCWKITPRLMKRRSNSL